MRVDPKVVKALTAAGLSVSLIISGGFLVAPWEGKVNKVYLDPVQILTSCYGHTGKELRIGQEFSDAECYKQLADDLRKAEAGVDRKVKVPLNVYQKAALVSFTYNAGEGNLAKSTMLAKFNAGDYVGGCQELIKWVYAKGVKLNGLVKRRNDEMDVCLGKADTVSFIAKEMGWNVPDNRK